MYLKLLLLVPLLTGFLLCEEVDDNGDYAEKAAPDYARLDELARLHALAILHLDKLGWPLGTLHRIRVGERWVKRSVWYKRGQFEPVYEEYFGLRCFPDILIMRSGAIYGTVTVPDVVGSQRTGVLLDLAVVDDYTRENLVNGFNWILSELKPAPIHL